MPSHKTTLIVYFIIAAALLFKLELHPKNLLYVASPAIIAALYWKKEMEFKKETLENIPLVAFLTFYGLGLIPQIYDTLRYNETMVEQSILSKGIFIVAAAMAFYNPKEKEVEEKEL